MRVSHCLVALLLLAGTPALVACGRSNATLSSPARLHIATLGHNDEPLRTDFDRDRGSVRLLFLVDPICPACLRGLADMGDDVLPRLPKGAHVKVYVVYESVLGGRKNNIPAAAALLKDPASRHYWNPSGDFGRQMSHTLGYWNGSHWVYAWDTWLIYPRDAAWRGNNPPRPAFLMHQLAALPHDSRFPFLDSRTFSAKLNEMLDPRAR